VGGDDVAIRPMQASDAESLVRCFERCYEGTYVADAFHDPAQLVARVAEGRLRPVVAVAPGEGVVGHMALTLHARGALTAEAGNTVVDPRYRGHHLAARLAVELSRLCVESGWVGFMHYPTTAHPVMQKLAVQGGGVEVGVLLDYIPAETRYVGFREPAAAARVAVTAVYQPLAEAPARRVWLPARHEALARSLYARARLDRDIAGSGVALPAASSQLTARFEERRGLLRIEAAALGADLCERVVAESGRWPAAPALVDLPLSEPALEAATEVLAEAGFCFGAVLPEYTATGDVLRLQRLAAEPPAPELATREARDLLSYTLADRR
jgi:hypothetical protein